MAVSIVHIALCTHRLSGAGRAPLLARDVARLLTARGISFQVFENDWPSGFSGFTDIWLVGGDGTLNYFVNHYPDNRLPLGIFPGGTGNDFHWLLYGETNTERQVDQMLLATPRSFDMGRCNGRFFLNNIGIGFEGAVAERLRGFAKRPGKAGYLSAVLRTVFRYRSTAYTLWYNGRELSGRFLILHISNGSRAGGGFHISPLAAADDGWLDLVLCRPLPVWKRLRYLPVMERGQHLSLPFIQHELLTHLTIDSPQPVSCHFDGEWASASRFVIEIIPGGLHIRV